MDDRPVADGFTATATAPDATDWARFRATLARNRTARIRVGAWVESGGERAGELEGEFAVIPVEAVPATRSRTP